jgi:hypothetical protein
MHTLLMYIVYLLTGRQPFTGPVLKAPRTYNEDALPSWLYLELKSRKPSKLLRWTRLYRAIDELTIEHCRALVDGRAGYAKNIIKTYNKPSSIQAEIAEGMKYKWKPRAVPLFIWIALGKLAVELLIWWFTQQQAAQAKEQK